MLKAKKEDVLIECACGCGNKLKEKDASGRKRKYINGHNGRKYENKNDHKHAWNIRNKKAKQQYKYEYIKLRKIKYILYKNGECEVCRLKYNGKNHCVFDFHHIDPSSKEIALNLASMNRHSLAKIESELEKCQLLCSNCHRLLHFEEEEKRIGKVG